MIGKAMEPSYLANEDVLLEFVAAFENLTLPKEQWTHTAHVTVAGFYLCRHSLPESIDRLRDNIKKFNLSVGGQNTESSGYHETLTVFWAHLIHSELSKASGRNIDRIRHVARTLGSNSRLFRSYYGFDVVASREARARWMPPDLLSLDTTVDADTFLQSH